MTDTVNTLERLANLLRIHSIESTQESNSGFVFPVHSAERECSTIASLVLVTRPVVHRWLKSSPSSSSM